MPKRKTKKYRRPRKIYDKSIIKEENDLIKKYGLKTRREVWKADFAISRIRNIAKDLITADDKSKEEFVSRQKEKGFNVNSIADVLGLDKEDYLKRRLQTLIVSMRLARTHKQARQFITHKHVTIDNKIINSPSHLTTLKEEKLLQLKLSLPGKKELTSEEKEFLKHMNKDKPKSGEH
jgi:small subunit ribosomal protein S4